MILSITRWPISALSRAYSLGSSSTGNHSANADAAALPGGQRSGSDADGIWNATAGSAGTRPRRLSSNWRCSSSGVAKKPIALCIFGSLRNSYGAANSGTPSSAKCICT